MGRRKLQDETRIISVLEFGAAYIIDFTVTSILAWISNHIDGEMSDTIYNVTRLPFSYLPESIQRQLSDDEFNFK